MTENNSTFGVSLVCSGSAVPAQVITNDELALRVETNDEWISSRTGIKNRRVLGPEESFSDLCLRAGASALEMANWQPETIDLVIVASSTPDDLFGSAPSIQAKLGAKNAVAFDLTAACSGFLFALVTAAQFLRNGSMKRALVIGADQLSSWIDWDDRKSCVLFGDAAGAVGIESVQSECDDLIGFKLRSDGSRGNCLNLLEKRNFRSLVNTTMNQEGGFSNIQMNGQEVYKFAVREVPVILKDVLETSGINPEKLDWLLLHQANKRILDAVADRLKISHEKVLSNLSKYGNTSAATIPLMLDEAVRDGRVKPGHLIASSGFGAGLSWGAAVFRWHGPT
ncbi:MULTISPECIES: beta-ketoacyl-ACP synthase III [Prochlorococcus]|uniref:beta-ketoacyl-ACP synthase III n=1 Tax=Prochlorococcus TaxID=1218 RepID=UPI000533AD0B|nr:MULTISPECIES: beta-ketoacyl-ACP synthase III [Prochlorococcus]KGG13240.1 3-oxoacyl-(acyl-carrier-protein) synthase [Prochlorococcus sp. MIT 0601]